MVKSKKPQSNRQPNKKSKVKVFTKKKKTGDPEKVVIEKLVSQYDKVSDLIMVNHSITVFREYTPNSELFCSSSSNLYAFILKILLDRY